MAKVFRFTDAVAADSVSGTGPFPTGTPFDTGASRPRPTTRQGIFDEIALALVAAGWTEVQHTAGSRHVYRSDGEDTTESVNIELNHLATDRYLHFNIGTKVDALDELEARIGNNVSSGAGADTNGRWDLGTSEFTSDFFILCDKDHLFAAFQNINHTSSVFWVSIGLGKRTNILNPNKYALVNNPIAGDYVSLDVTGSGNPVADGYRPGDTIDLVEIAVAEAPAARRLLVTAATPTSFEVLKLPIDFHAGALLGAQPSPLFRGIASDEVPDDTSVWSSPLQGVLEYAGSNPESAISIDGELLATALGNANGVSLSEVHFSANPGYSSSGEYGSGGTPNQRTQRFTCRNISLAQNNVEVALVHPTLLAFPASVGIYPHDWLKADRLTPPQYYVGFRPTSSTGERWGVGPTI